MDKKQQSIKISSDTYSELQQHKYKIGMATGKNTSIDAAIRDLLEIESSTKYYCMYQKITSSHLIIFGIGRTADEARRDTYAELGPGESSEGLDTSECTAEVYAYVDMHGGDAYEPTRFALNHGVVALEIETTN